MEIKLRFHYDVNVPEKGKITVTLMDRDTKEVYSRFVVPMEGELHEVLGDDPDGDFDYRRTHDSGPRY